MLRMEEKDRIGWEDIFEHQLLKPYMIDKESPYILNKLKINYDHCIGKGKYSTVLGC